MSSISRRLVKNHLNAPGQAFGNIPITIVQPFTRQVQVRHVHQVSLSESRLFDRRGIIQWLSLAARRTTRQHPLSTHVQRPYVDTKLSYAFGRSNEHLIYSTVARELDKSVEERPNEVAFASHYEQIEKTYATLNDDVNKLAKSLVRKFNIERGDFVGVFSYNCYNWLVVQFACSKVGAVLTPINPSYKAHELAYILAKGKIKCLFMPGPKSIQRELNNHLELIQSSVVIDLFSNGYQTSGGQCSARPLLENVIYLDSDNEYSTVSLSEPTLSKYCRFHSWQDAQSDGIIFKSSRDAEEAGFSPEKALVLEPELVSPDDLFAVYYTSGTTGTPKGACCSHLTVINNARFYQIKLRQGRPRSWKLINSSTLPLFHIYAGVLNALSPLISNNQFVFSSYKYDIHTYVESIMKCQANFTALTPTMLIDLLTYVEQNKCFDLPLKIIQPGGAYLPPELVARAFKTLPQLEDVRTGYASTENGAGVTLQSIHELEATRASSVGGPIDFTEIRIVDPHDGNLVLPLCQIGEIQTRGYNTMLEYLNEPDKTNQVITANRWYRTGDLGFMHPHGSVEIKGRLKHMIVKGGENIYPQEIEQMMRKMTFIEETHIIGVPDKRFGEQVCAWVKLKSGFRGSGGDFVEEDESLQRGEQKEITKKEIIEFCKQNITYFKVPKYIFFVDNFPMTSTKKVHNHEMVKRSVEVLGLDDQA